MNVRDHYPTIHHADVKECGCRATYHMCVEHYEEPKPAPVLKLSEAVAAMEAGRVVHCPNPTWRMRISGGQVQHCHAKETDGEWKYYIGSVSLGPYTLEPEKKRCKIEIDETSYERGIAAECWDGNTYVAMASHPDRDTALRVAKLAATELGYSVEGDE